MTVNQTVLGVMTRQGAVYRQVRLPVHALECVCRGEMLCEIIPLPMSRVALVEDKIEKTTEMGCCQNLNTSSFEKKNNGLLIINNNCHSAFTHRISKTLRKKTLP